MLPVLLELAVTEPPEDLHQALAVLVFLAQPGLNERLRCEGSCEPFVQHIIVPSRPIHMKGRATRVHTLWKTGFIRNPTAYGCNNAFPAQPMNPCPSCIGSPCGACTTIERH